MLREWVVSMNGGVADFGCGPGSLGLAVAEMTGATDLVLLDRDESILDAARAQGERRVSDGCRLSVVLASAESTPLPSDRAAVVCCQCLLMHCKPVESVLEEMVRVVRPGGSVLVVEPNNLAACEWSSDPMWTEEVRRELDAWEATINRGRQLLGHGDHSIGARLPVLLAASGLKRVEIRLCETAYYVVPDPTDHRCASWQRDFEEYADDVRRNQDYLRNLYVAGGGTAAQHQRLSDRRVHFYLRWAEMARRGELGYSATGALAAAHGVKPR